MSIRIRDYLRESIRLRRVEYVKKIVEEQYSAIGIHDMRTLTNYAKFRWQDSATVSYPTYLHRSLAAGKIYFYLRDVCGWVVWNYDDKWT